MVILLEGIGEYQEFDPHNLIKTLTTRFFLGVDLNFMGFVGENLWPFESLHDRITWMAFLIYNLIGSLCQSHIDKLKDSGPPNVIQS